MKVPVLSSIVYGKRIPPSILNNILVLLGLSTKLNVILPSAAPHEGGEKLTVGEGAPWIVIAETSVFVQSSFDTVRVTVFALSPPFPLGLEYMISCGPTPFAEEGTASTPKSQT